MSYSAFRLQQSINHHEFTPFYQPIVGAHGNIIGCEILARWLNPVRGLLSASSFIDSIEAAGLTGALLHSLAGEVMKDIPELLISSRREFMLTLNISLSQVMEPVSRYDLLALNIQLRRAGVTPVFEVTEREDIHCFPEAAAVFDGLVCQGMLFAVDDFGSGFAGEALLRATQATLIKIDRRFVSGPVSPLEVPVLERTLRLARTTGARVLAEGVETAEQGARMRAAGVTYLQGMYYGAPMPFGLLQYHLSRKSLACAL